jgi:hypothetical protein
MRHAQGPDQDRRSELGPIRTGLRHAYRLFTLPLHHADPFDRMIIATALVEDVPLFGGAGKWGLLLRDVWRIIVDKWHVQPLALRSPQLE